MSFFYSNVIYRLPIGSYGYLLVSDLASWVIITIFLLKSVFGQAKIRRSEARVGLCLLIINMLMYALLVRVYFESHRLFSEFGRAAADTLRCSQFILGYFAIRASGVSSRANWRYLRFAFILAFLVAVCGLVLDVGMHMPRHYAGVTNNLLRPKGQFTAFFTDNHASAAVYLLAALSIGFGLALKQCGTMSRLAIFGCCGVIVVAIVLSKSRSGLLGLSVASLLFVIQYLMFQRSKVHALLTMSILSMLLVGMVTLLASGKLLGNSHYLSDARIISNYEKEKVHIQSKEQKVDIISVQSRFENWKKTFDLIQNMSYNMFFGYGVNQQTFMLRFGGAHNNFFEYMIDMGIVGLALFLTLLYRIGRLFRPDRKLDSDTRALLAGMQCGFAGLVVTCFTQETFYMAPAMGNFFGFYLVVVAIAENIRREGRADENGASI
jgi:O-antigen ligase